MFKNFHFDMGHVSDVLEKASPTLAKKLSSRILGFVSPFNSHLKLSILKWTKEVTEISVKSHRGVQNHVGGIHAGALFTLGETCAGFLIIKHFSFKEFRPLMSEASAQYHKQARNTTVRGIAKVTTAEINKIHKILKTGEPAFLPMKTEIFDDKNVLVAEIKTHWQIKPWTQVKTRDKK